MKASELIGSQVLELYGATMCGTVCGILPTDNLRKIRALEILTENEDDCEKKYVETNRLTAVCDGVVTVRSKDLLVMQFPFSESPVNLPAYSETGEFYGRITDIAADEKYNITAIRVGEREFTPADILTKSGELIVFRLPGSKTRISKPVKRVPKLPPPAPAAPAAERSADAPAGTTVRITAFKRYAFLVGRTLAEDVTDLKGEPVAVRGEAVTQEMIDRARGRGAIVRLAMAAK